MSGATFCASSCPNDHFVILTPRQGKKEEQGVGEREAIRNDHHPTPRNPVVHFCLTGIHSKGKTERRNEKKVLRSGNASVNMVIGKVGQAKIDIEDGEEKDKGKTAELKRRFGNRVM